MATVNARAEQYKESDAFGDTPMDVLRAHAYLDLINGVPAAERIALAEQQDDLADDAQARAAADAGPGHEAGPAPGDAHPDPEARANPDECPCAECDGSCRPHDDDLDGSGQADDDDDRRPTTTARCPTSPTT